MTLFSLSSRRNETNKNVHHARFSVPITGRTNGFNRDVTYFNTFHGVLRTLSLRRIDLSSVVVQGVRNCFERYRNDFTGNFRVENFRCELYIHTRVSRERDGRIIRNVTKFLVRVGWERSGAEERTRKQRYRRRHSGCCKKKKRPVTVLFSDYLVCI